MKNGRYLLNFWQVDYLADVWVNGKYVGQHEGTGDPFTLRRDGTDPAACSKPGCRACSQPEE